MRNSISSAREIPDEARFSRAGPAIGTAFTGALLSAFVFFTHMGDARADDTRDTAGAETLFRDGKALLAQGRTSDACAKFASSYHIDPQVGTLLFLATCHEAQGKMASAWNEFNAALSAMQVAHNSRREAFAQQHLDALSGKLSRLVVTAAAAPRALEVKLDDQRIETDVLGVPLPVDAGPHTISASAPDHRPWSTTIDVAQGPLDLTVTVPPLQRDPSAALPPSSPLSASPPPATAAPQATAQIPSAAPGSPAPPPASLAASTTSVGAAHAVAPTSTSSPGMYVAGGIGIAGLTVGIATGVIALVDKNDADSGSCSGKYCTQHGLDLYARATTAAWISTGAFAAGTAGAVVAVSALLFGRRPPAEQGSMQVLPTLGGLQFRGAF